MPKKKSTTSTAVDSSTLENLALNSKQLKARRNKAKEANLRMRKALWPDVGPDQLWLREDKTKKGFSTIPRTLPLFMQLINDVSKRVTDGKSAPAGRAYLVLWCRVFDEGFLKVDSEATAALEAGYAGERNVSTWREHMRILRDLGFIDYRQGPAGPMQFVLILNPYRVLQALNEKGWVQELTYTAIYQRALEIGASDLDATIEEQASKPSLATPSN